MLKQFPELFYSQNSRVLETAMFQALFSQWKASVCILINFQSEYLRYFMNYKFLIVRKYPKQMS